MANTPVEEVFGHDNTSHALLFIQTLPTTPVNAHPHPSYRHIKPLGFRCKKKLLKNIIKNILLVYASPQEGLFTVNID